MLDSIKVGNFIMYKRRALGLTQQQLADKLNISYQAISKWENGTTYPNIEILKDLEIASNGLHTNGYSLVRLLMDKMPKIKLDKIDGLTFIEQIMKPHTPYYKAIKGLFDKNVIHGMAHITGGGIEGNLCRVIPEGLCAKIDLTKIKLLNIFKYIRNNGNISDDEMLRTFNCGVGFNIVVSQKYKKMVIKHVSQFYDCYEIGIIENGDKKILFDKRFNWL